MELTKEYADGHTMQRYVVMNIVREFSKELSKMQGRCIDVGSGLGDVTKDILLPNLSSTVEIVGERRRVWPQCAPTAPFNEINSVFFV